MKHSLLELLCCPACKADLQLSEMSEKDGEVESGSLVCAGCEQAYPVVDFVPRFVPAENYASSFGFQWNRFRQVQLDSHTGQPISRDRFIRQTGWSDLSGKLVLDAGCGAGRFAEVALALGATLVAVDYSSAVDACRQNLGDQPNFHVVQADIYELPFCGGPFDYVYSLGVLQHTPDVRRAFMALPEQLSAGGRLVVDLYIRNLGTLLHPKTWLRPISRRISQDRLFAIVERWVPGLLSISRAIGGIPLIGRFLKRLVPVANYDGQYPLSEDQLHEWAVLDTFDWLSPRYDKPQTAATLRSLLTDADLEEIEVFKADHLTGRGRRSPGSGAG
jgi:uncharacterized protein YbaR (Trm112 family)